MANYFYSLNTILMGEMIRIVASDQRSRTSAHLARLFVGLQNEENA